MGRCIGAFCHHASFMSFQLAKGAVLELGISRVQRDRAAHVLQQRRTLGLPRKRDVVATHTQQVHWTTLASMYDCLPLSANAAVKKSAAALLHLYRTLQTKPKCKESRVCNIEW